jgi:hypothetical protein
MTTMLKRAARALHASESAGEQAWDDLDVITRSAFKRDAAAVIEAIREPDEAVIDAGDEIIGACHGQQEPADAVDVWAVMIDTILSDRMKGG